MAASTLPTIEAALKEFATEAFRSVLLAYYVALLYSHEQIDIISNHARKTYVTNNIPGDTRAAVGHEFESNDAVGLASAGPGFELGVCGAGGEEEGDEALKKEVTFTQLDTTGSAELDEAFTYGAKFGMYNSTLAPNPDLVALGVKFVMLEEFLQAEVVPRFG
ncbi:hypothetical protein R3P38DRAFT_3232749 [Favolaschia claudopus]|uniref:Uncharacterized protein n=1 Tax=Favolaschia claudopus TaxID=2862362 RepID=A0AAV9ZJB4_9AGAR